MLDVCLKPNFAGVERVRLYSETFYGTKDLVEGYIDEVSLALQFVRESQEATLEEKKRFFKSANKVSPASDQIKHPPGRRRKHLMDHEGEIEISRGVKLIFSPFALSRRSEFRIFCSMPQRRSVFWILPHRSRSCFPQRRTATESRDGNERWSPGRRVRLHPSFTDCPQ